MKANNIILTGMSGSGKSTLGVILAKRIGYDFVDTDLLIQQKYHKLLQEIIDTEGNAEFARKEEAVLREVDFKRTVISTGGSAVYYEKAMENLKRQGIVVYLAVPYQEILRRIISPGKRGILIPEGLTLEDVCREREPLYRKYADLILPVARERTEETVQRLQQAVEEFVLSFRQAGIDSSNSFLRK